MLFFEMMAAISRMVVDIGLVIYHYLVIIREKR